MARGLYQGMTFPASGRVRRRSVLVVIVTIITLGVAAVLARSYLSVATSIVAQKLRGEKSVADRLREYSVPVQQRLASHFTRAGVAYPPAQLAVLGFKQERRLDLYASGLDGAFKFVRSYPIVGASGRVGPKLREGDNQVPEGLYRISFLNPNSLFHLSLRVNYPNDFDRAQATRDGRQQLGGDIMIHGSSASAGCLAMGDEASEELFVLAALTGIQNIRVVISPVDFRTQQLSSPPAGAPAWTAALYAQIRTELRRYQVGPAASLRAPDKTVAAGFSLRGKGAPVKGATTGESVLLGALKGRSCSII